jgi:PiT family inorganic phosphate transporter
MRWSAGLAGAVVAAVGSEYVIWGWTPLMQEGKLLGVMKVLVSLFLSPLLGFWVGFLVFRIGRKLMAGAKPTANATLRKMQFVSAAVLAFSHGANDAQKSMGMLTLVLLLGGFIPKLRGAVLGRPRLRHGDHPRHPLRRLAHRAHPRLCHLPRTPHARPLVAAHLRGADSLAASVVGAPVSTTHVVATSIMGIGYSERPRAVRWKKAVDIAKTWVITIPASALTAIVCYALARIMLGQH